MQQVVERVAALRAHDRERALLRVLPDRESVLEDRLPLRRQVQTAAAATRGRVHVDVAQREEALQVARERRFFDVELMPDLDGRDGVARGKLSEQRVLARGDP